ncbi:PREDICTED: uncharacterized protein LOC104810388 [Tarenaya hassleriana]|uniref:uncharacterized protein LOC104810388 n=1 Tax=Tarenaya hassleriana TaxID=28532 RepID=UPI00053C3149|nr:PREDICTED: uncharacterized protein LOC104810388 [Tarenaya hassleriana]
MKSEIIAPPHMSAHGKGVNVHKWNLTGENEKSLSLSLLDGVSLPLFLLWLFFTSEK